MSRGSAAPPILHAVKTFRKGEHRSTPNQIKPEPDDERGSIMGVQTQVIINWDALFDHACILCTDQLFTCVCVCSTMCVCVCIKFACTCIMYDDNVASRLYNTRWDKIIFKR